MNVIYAMQTIPEDLKAYTGPTSLQSIFLAGPTPRSPDVKSWRPEALGILEFLGCKATVFVPEDEATICREGKPRSNYDYDGQIEWEEQGLTAATCIVFWIPRDLKTMPAFTTNIEWGTWHKSAKCVVGAPENTPKMGYIKYYAQKNGIPYTLTLEDTLKNALKCLDYYVDRR